MTMTRPEECPDWLRKLAENVIGMEDWPNGEYPSVAFSVREIVGEECTGDDSQVCLLQEVINECERLRPIVEAAWGMRREAASYNPCPDLGLRVLHREHLYELLDHWKTTEREKKE